MIYSQEKQKIYIIIFLLDILKKIYNLHIAESKNKKALNQRKIELFVKDFKLVEKIPKLSKELVHIICSKILKNKYC